MYRIGFPFWRSLARSGMTMKLRVNVMRDDEAGVFVATSPDLRGMVAEAQTMDELVTEVRGVVEDLMTEELHVVPRRHPVTDLRLCAA